MAVVENSSLYPTQDHFQRSLVDQWLDFYTIHLGRWLGTLLFERVFRSKMGLGETKAEMVEESLNFINQQMTAVNQHLESHKYLAGDNLSIADLFAPAYVVTTKISGVDLGDFPKIKSWHDQLQGLESVKKTRELLHLEKIGL